MTGQSLLQIILYLAVLLALVKPLGNYMARVYQEQPVFLNRWLAGFENLLYRCSGVDAKQDMRWTQYALALLVFNGLGLLTVYALQRLQGLLPFNPQNLSAVSSDSALNTAISFATNTNWQAYSGETTMSYCTQMLGLTVQNFLSAASGMAVLVALVRGFIRRNSDGIGNFWVDMTRSTLYILLPLSLMLAVLLVGQGVIQTFKPYQNVSGFDVQSKITSRNSERTESGINAPFFEKEGVGEIILNKSPLSPFSKGEVIPGSVSGVSKTATETQQTLALGSAASQIAIKQLGTNGGGFFNVNSAHPFENPTPLANFLEMLAILLIPAALCYSFGVMVGDPRQGWVILAAMTLIFTVLIFVTVNAEQNGNPAFIAMHIDQHASELQAGGNMEGKETRFGIVNSALWAVATTAASNGSVNAMHDSFTPLGGLVPMWLMQLGEVIFGGVGSGLYGMIVFAIVAVFIAGLMIGRTPEYLGKKIEAFEMQMAAVIILVPPLMVLGGTALALMLDVGKAGIFNNGAHGFSEVLYALSSAGNNNGSAFAGLSANTLFYNLMLGLIMLLSRYGLMIPVLALAGSLASKKIVPASSGTLPTHTPLFMVLLIITVVMVGALTFVPALALGPIVEHLQMIQHTRVLP